MSKMIFSLLITLMILPFMAGAQVPAKSKVSKVLPKKEVTPQVEPVSSAEMVGVEVTAPQALPIAPQSYDRLGGEVYEPFAPDEQEKVAIRKRIEKRRALLAKKRAAAKKKAMLAKAKKRKAKARAVGKRFRKTPKALAAKPSKKFKKRVTTKKKAKRRTKAVAKKGRAKPTRKKRIPASPKKK